MTKILKYFECDCTQLSHKYCKLIFQNPSISCKHVWRLLLVSLWCTCRYGRWLPAYQVAPFARLSTTLFQVRFSIHAKTGKKTRFFDEKVFSQTLVVSQTGSLPLKAEHIGAVNCTYLAMPTIGSYLWKWRFFGIFSATTKNHPKREKHRFHS